MQASLTELGRVARMMERDDRRPAVATLDRLELARARRARVALALKALREARDRSLKA